MCHDSKSLMQELSGCTLERAAKILYYWQSTTEKCTQQAKELANS